MSIYAANKDLIYTDMSEMPLNQNIICFSGLGLFANISESNSSPIVQLLNDGAHSGQYLFKLFFQTNSSNNTIRFKVEVTNSSESKNSSFWIDTNLEKRMHAQCVLAFSYDNTNKIFKFNFKSVIPYVDFEHVSSQDFGDVLFTKFNLSSVSYTYLQSFGRTLNGIELSRQDFRDIAVRRKYFLDDFLSSLSCLFEFHSPATSFSNYVNGGSDMVIDSAGYVYENTLPVSINSLDIGISIDLKDKYLADVGNISNVCGIISYIYDGQLSDFQYPFMNANIVDSKFIFPAELRFDAEEYLLTLYKLGSNRSSDLVFTGRVPIVNLA